MSCHLQTSTCSTSSASKSPVAAVTGPRPPTFAAVRASRFLHEVQSYSGRNRTSVQNLAAVFGPNILRAKAEEPQGMMGG